MRIKFLYAMGVNRKNMCKSALAPWSKNVLLTEKRIRKLKSN